MFDQHLFRTIPRSTVALVFVAAATIAHAADVSYWQTDFDAAYSEAVREKRPLLIHFYGQQCPPCRRMEREVLNQREVIELLQNQYIAVKVDAGNPANAKGGQLVQRFGVHALPCDVIVDPITGRLLSQVEGFQDLAGYRTTALRSRSRFDQSHQILIVNQQPEETHAADAEDTTDADDVKLGAPQPIVGIDGYSPVALGAERRWVRGKPEFAFEFKGVTYYMATVDELAAFRRRPDDFAPRLLGCDAVVLSETDRAVAGSTDYAAFYDGDLYLFESAESRRRFKTNPPRYTRIQHVLKVDNIQRVAHHPDAANKTR